MVYTTLKFVPLQSKMIGAAASLDQKTLGGMWTAQAYKTEIERDNSLCLGIMAHSGQLVGMGVTWIVVDEAHVILIAVDPSWQSKCLGSLILNRLLRFVSKDYNCHRATLEVNRFNQAAINLYQKFRFQSLGVRPNYYGKGKDALIFWLSHIQGEVYDTFLTQSFLEDQYRLEQRGIQLIDCESESLVNW